MANFGELSGVKQLGVLIGGAALVTAALYFTVFKSQREANAGAQQKLEAKLKENAELESYRPKLKEIELQLVNLKQQLDIERRIVPDEKEVDGFMELSATNFRPLETFTFIAVVYFFICWPLAMVVVTEQGCEVLMPTNKDFIAI